jgi:RNA polymerase sigma-70 factor (ECF subfamily)
VVISPVGMESVVEPVEAGDALDALTLVARAREGDVRAYEEVVRRYQAPIYGLALRMLSSRGDAEDVVQEVFLTAWRRLDHLREDAAFVSWLYRITTNRCLTALRARRPEVDLELDQRDLGALVGIGQPQQAAETSAELVALDAALRRLTRRQRACWLLREVHGRSYDEIAEAIGTTTPAVRGRIARARVELAELMAPWK